MYVTMQRKCIAELILSYRWSPISKYNTPSNILCPSLKMFKELAFVYREALYPYEINIQDFRGKKYPEQTN